MTTTPSPSLAHIHNRMPAILMSDDEEDWLDPDLVEPEQILRFLAPYPDGLLEALPALARLAHQRSTKPSERYSDVWCGYAGEAH